MNSRVLIVLSNFYILSKYTKKYTLHPEIVQGCVCTNNFMGRTWCVQLSLVFFYAIHFYHIP